MNLPYEIPYLLFWTYGPSPAPPVAWRSHSAMNVQTWAAPRHPSLHKGCSWKTHKEFPCAISCCVGGTGTLPGSSEILSALLCTNRDRKKSLCPLHGLTLIHTTCREEPQCSSSLFCSREEQHFQPRTHHIGTAKLIT